MNVVGFVSSYREGGLVRGAIDSLLDVGLDRLYIYEGPAGPPLENESELPKSDFAHQAVRARLTLREGRWRTDGRKRNDWLQQVRKDYAEQGPVWAVVVDADELLINGRYLRDRLEWILARDEHAGASIATPDNPPMSRWPLRLVEHTGELSLITARVFRADLLRSIDHSTSIVTNVGGVREGWGNYGEQSKVWIERWLAAIDAGHMIAWPPMPGEPHLVHRSNLRHPGRAQLRMSDQEAVEFAKAEALERGEAPAALGTDGPVGADTFERGRLH